MATPIAPTNLAIKNLNGQRYAVVRTAVAQADTGQIDWLWTPAWAKVAIVYFNVSATSGTNPSFLPQLVTSDPILLDSSAPASGGGAKGTICFSNTGGITSVGNVNMTLSPGETGIADKIVIAASGATTISINGVVPQLLGINTVLSRANGNETYTYTIGVEFYGKEKL